jgi:hypothetical protein
VIRTWIATEGKGKRYESDTKKRRRMKMNLYEIDEAMYIGCVDEETGEIDTVKLEALQMERDKKISNLACWVKDLAAEEEAIANEMRALGKRKSAVGNRKESVKNYLQGYLNGEKFKDGRCSISYRKSKSVEIDESVDPLTLPQELVKVTVEPSKTLIKEAIEAGREITGCRIVEKENIQIR